MILSVAWRWGGKRDTERKLISERKRMWKDTFN